MDAQFARPSQFLDVAFLKAENRGELQCARTEGRSRKGVWQCHPGPGQRHAKSTRIDPPIMRSMENVPQLREEPAPRQTHALFLVMVLDESLRSGVAPSQDQGLPDGQLAGIAKANDGGPPTPPRPAGRLEDVRLKADERRLLARR